MLAYALVHHFRRGAPEGLLVCASSYQVNAQSSVDYAGETTPFSDTCWPSSCQTPKDG